MNETNGHQMNQSTESNEMIQKRIKELEERILGAEEKAVRVEQDIYSNLRQVLLNYVLRMQKTAQYAKQNNYEIFATTLSVSPHKNAQLINELGKQLEQDYSIEYLISDFKKQDGYLNSIKLSKQYNLYRQKYCGCKYSIY